jgi:hypothetical protein
MKAFPIQHFAGLYVFIYELDHFISLDCHHGHPDPAWRVKSGLSIYPRRLKTLVVCSVVGKFLLAADRPGWFAAIES